LLSFLFHARAPTDISTLSLHDALPIYIADFLIVEIADGELHAAGPSAPSAAGSWAAAGSSAASGGGASVPSPRRAAGNGNPSGALRFAASLIKTQPPSLPGTAPMIIRTPRSASAET